MTASESRRRSLVAEEEGGIEGDTSGLFRSREPTERMREALRSSGARRRGEGEAVVAVVIIDGPGAHGQREGREQRRGEAEWIGQRDRGGCVATSWASRR